MKNESKLEKYRKGKYVLTQGAPSVPTTLWSESDWVTYIDTFGKWTV